MSDEVECPICTDFYSDRENDSFVVAGCGHLFHKFCIQEELRHRPRCPVCSKNTTQQNFTPLYGIVPKKCVKTFKITTVGNAAVGKSSLVHQYCYKAFHEFEPPTVGVEFNMKTLEVAGENVKLSLWDTAGQELYKSLTHQYIRDSQGIVIVFDTLHSETLEDCLEWFKFANLYAPNAVKILLGARKDLKTCSTFLEGTCRYTKRSRCPPNKCRPPTSKEVDDMATKLGIAYFETSAKADFNVDVAFRTLVGQILQNRHLVREAIKNDPARRIQLAAQRDTNVQPEQKTGWNCC